jgi:hypothetical protein
MCAPGKERALCLARKLRSDEIENDGVFTTAGYSQHTQLAIPNQPCLRLQQKG